MSEAADRLEGLVLTLGHGASGTKESMRPHVAGLAKRGIDAVAIDLPKRKAEDAIPAFAAQLPEWAAGLRIAIGGHSYGGRVASLLAAQRPVDALVLFSFPLHRPGGPEIGARVAHFADIACPTLFLSGAADPFARIDLLQEAVTSLSDAELVIYPRLGHGLGPVLDDALDRVAAFLRERVGRA